MKTVEVRKAITAANDHLAEQIRQRFARHGILALNLIASPGAGKTALIEKTIDSLGNIFSINVVEGDPYTSLDSERIIHSGGESVQINTEGGCHLDARMVNQAIDRFDLANTDLIIIENVGNLLCPAAWDLGQDLTVVVTSLPEGTDKPFKYPETFSRAQVTVINKIDLEPHLPATAAVLKSNAQMVNPALSVFEVSCLAGTGLESWYRWIVAAIKSKKRSPSHA